MEKSLYVKYRQELAGLRPAYYKGYLHLALFFGATATGIGLSLSSSPLFYVLGQILLTLSFLNGQILLHELGHGTFLPGRKLNHFFGHIIALAPIIPYRPWELIHGQHHKWSGNKYKDPTMVDQNYEDLSEAQKKIINFCWKFWVPIFGVSYSLRSFWNLKQLNRLFPHHRTSIIISMAAPIIFYGTLVSLFGLTFFKAWFPAYYVFMAIGEPLLFSQHVHMDQGDARDENFNKDSSYHVRDQDIFSRTLTFPGWFSKWVLMGFNQHALHHVFPNLPAYEYYRVTESFQNTVDWKEWYFFSKRTDAATLLFKTNRETRLIKGQL